jgi:hypothetical protein
VRLQAQQWQQQLHLCMWPHGVRPHCSTADAPTRDLLNSQHLTNDELCGLVDYCYKTGTREGLQQVAAMVLLGIYGGLR